jgi:hypothetical protein
MQLLVITCINSGIVPGLFLNTLFFRYDHYFPFDLTCHFLGEKCGGEGFILFFLN